MRFDTIVLDEKNIGREIERFVSITDRRHWERVISNYDKASGITYRYYLTRRNPLIEPLKEYFKLQKQGRSIWKNRTPQIEFLAMQAFTINNITKNLSKKGTGASEARHERKRVCLETRLPIHRDNTSRAIGSFNASGCH